MPTKTKKVNLESIKQKVKIYKKLSLACINSVLATLFYIIWILIGLFVLLFIYANIKQGMFRNLFGSSPSSAQQQTTQMPTETELPGVGTVNIECVQSSLSQEAIQKLVTDGSIENLSEEENKSLEPCIVKKEEASEKPTE
jgi:hypothetical protein